MGKISFALLAALALTSAVRADEPEFREQIVNGVEVGPKDPIARSTVIALDGEGDSIEGCSGSVIAPHWVVVAAHCVTEDPEAMTGTIEPGRVRLVFGNAKLSKDGSRISGGSPQLRADRVIIHPQFGGRKGIYGPQRHDVALIHFAGNLPPGFAPARFLNEADAKLAVGTAVILAGYGTDRPKTTAFAMTLRSFETIVANLPTDSSVVTMRPAAGHPGGSCQGDSGGPAFVKDAAGVVLWGVSSAADAGCTKLAQYEDLRRYRGWLKTVIGPAPTLSSAAVAVRDGFATMGVEPRPDTP